jgi:hypothetical protein
MGTAPIIPALPFAQEWAKHIADAVHRDGSSWSLDRVLARPSLVTCSLRAGEPISDPPSNIGFVFILTGGVSGGFWPPFLKKTNTKPALVPYLSSTEPVPSKEEFAERLSQWKCTEDCTVAYLDWPSTYVRQCVLECVHIEVFAQLSHAI